MLHDAHGLGSGIRRDSIAYGVMLTSSMVVVCIRTEDR